MPDQLTQAGALPTVSHSLRTMIRERGLTAYTLAKRARVGVDPIHRFLNGERGLNLATLDRVCTAMGLALLEAHSTNSHGARQAPPQATEAVADQARDDTVDPDPPERTPMAFFTIATNDKANLDDTARLLFSHGAVWLPPMSIPPCGAIPQPGDRFWLLYLDGGQTKVLGGGPLALAPRVMGRRMGRAGYTVLWNDRDQPGLRDDARGIGYPGPHNMTFFRLDPPHLFSLNHAQPVALPGPWNTGLNLASAPQEAVLQTILPV
jgi:DNA-binding phage protein